MKEIIEKITELEKKLDELWNDHESHLDELDQIYEKIQEVEIIRNYFKDEQLKKETDRDRLT